MSITVNLLPEEVAARITAEATRRGVSPEQIAAEAIEARFPAADSSLARTDRHPRRRLAFAAIGTSTAADTDAILAEGFGQTDPLLIVDTSALVAAGSGDPDHPRCL